MTYSILGHQRDRRDERVDIKRLVEDRVEYFKAIADSKRVSFELNLESSILFVDLIKITRVIDNLISNAIKYNRRNGKIEIILREDYLLISDSGVG